MIRGEIEDISWIRNSFLVPKFANSGDESKFRTFSTAFLKFTDTTLGGNFYINSSPQFTKFADLRVRSAAMANESAGMGRKYSEMIDDNAQIIYMRFGVPQFSSFLSFYTQFYDYESSTISKTGRSPGFFYKLSKAVTFVVTLPLQAIIFVGRLVKFMMNKPTGKFYYMKPTMPVYYNVATTILNTLLVYDGIIPKVMVNKENADNPEAQQSLRMVKNDPKADESKYLTGEIDDEEPIMEDYGVYHRLLPNVFTSSGGVDLLGVVNRAQRASIKARRNMREILDNAESDDILDVRASANEWMRKRISQPNKLDGNSIFNKDGDKGSSLNSYIAAWESLPIGTVNYNDKETSATESVDFKNTDTWSANVYNFFMSEVEDGSQFVGFKVNETGVGTESFSNSTGEPELKGQINGFSRNMASKRFDFAGGKIFEGGGMLQSAINSVKDVAMGTLKTLNLEGLGGMLGSAFVDIPDRWEDSTADLPTMSYTIELKSPYGNSISRMMNLWVPLSLLLAGALPKSVGKSAYDSPFLVELYDKGKAQTRLGMIDSMSIERGTGNVGWSKDRKPLGITVTFTVKDLSSIVTAPLNASPGIFDEQSAFSDYMAVLGGMNLTDQIYPVNRLRINLALKMKSWKDMTNAGTWGTFLAGTTPGRMLNLFARNADRGMR